LIYLNYSVLFILLFLLYVTFILYVTFTSFSCSVLFFPVLFNVLSYVFFCVLLHLGNFLIPVYASIILNLLFEVVLRLITFLLTLLSVAFLFLISACNANPPSDVSPDPLSLKFPVSTTPSSHLMASHVYISACPPQDMLYARPLYSYNSRTVPFSIDYLLL